MSKWIVDVHGDIEGDYELICKAESIIPLAKVKQAREEIKDNSIEVYTGYETYEMLETKNALDILNKLIAESEG